MHLPTLENLSFCDATSFTIAIFNFHLQLSISNWLAALQLATLLLRMARLTCLGKDGQTVGTEIFVSECFCLRWMMVTSSLEFASLVNCAQASAASLHFAFCHFAIGQLSIVFGVSTRLSMAAVTVNTQLPCWRVSVFKYQHLEILVLECLWVAQWSINVYRLSFAHMYAFVVVDGSWHLPDKLPYDIPFKDNKKWGVLVPHSPCFWPWWPWNPWWVAFRRRTRPASVVLWIAFDRICQN